MMIGNEVSFTSLCYITQDYEGRIWLNRLADAWRPNDYHVSYERPGF